MNLAHVKANFEYTTVFRGGGSIQASNKGVLAGGEVGINFCTHGLCYVNRGFHEGEPGVITNNGGVFNVFWANAKNDLFVDIVANVLDGSGLLGGDIHLECLCVDGVNLAFLLQHYI